MDSEIEEKIRKMKVKELKVELKQLNININDVFEKEELVKRLYNAKMDMKLKSNSSPNIQKKNSEQNPIPINNSDTIEIPMKFISSEQGTKSVKSSDDSNAFLRPSPGQFPALEIEIPDSKGPQKKITLLLDTACSGIVLRPSTVQQLQLQSLDAPTTMMAAGGTSMGGKITQFPSISLTTTQNSNHFIRGPFPVFIQDIGVLPPELDGIMGLSFLSRFQTVDFNFSQSILSLTRDKSLGADMSPTFTNVAESTMQLTGMGIYIVNVLLDGKGPIKMLVDTGAASTILNWKGVSDMGLSKSSPLITPNTDQMIGAMGADNVAYSLSHSYILKRRYNLQQDVGKTSVGVKVVSNVKIDIGNLPVLESMQSFGVGGILGSDLLMRSDLIRFIDMKGSKAKIVLYQR